MKTLFPMPQSQSGAGITSLEQRKPLVQVIIEKGRRKQCGRKWIGHVIIVTGCGFREGAHSERLTKQTVFFASTILSRLSVDGGIVHCSGVNTAHCAPNFPIIHSSSVGGVGALTPCFFLVANSSFLDPVSRLASRLLKHQLPSGLPIIFNPD